MKEIKIEKIKLNISTDTRSFLISFIITAIITYALTYTNTWQLIIISGTIGGLLNKTMKRGIYSGAFGVSLVWILFMAYLMSLNNAYTNLDQFAGLIFGGLGYGWVILVIIILFGILFGALGGAIGSGIRILLRSRFTKESSNLD